jgi:hypothetical protein
MLVTNINTRMGACVCSAVVWTSSLYGTLILAGYLCANWSKWDTDFLPNLILAAGLMAVFVVEHITVTVMALCLHCEVRVSQSNTAHTSLKAMKLVAIVDEQMASIQPMDIDVCWGCIGSTVQIRPISTSILHLRLHLTSSDTL